ncbi:MAG: PASTA domain-containing protein [bacterium]|nr:PASTA domain-containing protein [bacterium]
MHDVLLFIKSKKFLIHFGIGLSLIAILVVGTLKWLSSYTNHGEFVVVPEFKGKFIGDLADFVKDKDISYQIIDSVYDPKQKPGIVLWQDPIVEAKVKHNRTVYLYVTGMVPPQIIMPKLIDRSERQAKLILTSYGLRIGKVEERQADCNGCVLAQIANGRAIEAGKMIKKGTVVSLIVGRKDAFYNAASDSTLPEIEEQVPNFDQE